jgi:hypothetical protein
MKMARLLTYGFAALAISSFMGQMATAIPFFRSLTWVVLALMVAVLVAVLFAGDAFDAYLGHEMRWSFATVLGLFSLCIVGGLLGCIVLL